MSLDSEFLRSIRHRSKFKERIGTTPLYLFEEKTRDLIKLMSRYFKTYKAADVILKDDFITWLNELKGDKLTESDSILFQALMEDFEYDLSAAAEQFLTERLQESDLVYKTADLIEKWSNGDEIEIIEQMKIVTDKAAFGRADRDGIRTVTESIEEILEHAGSKWGFEWELPILAKAMRPAQPGDMILIAARPDQGKTTFIGNIVRPWLGQLDEIFPDEERCILWLNNEGPGTRIKLRNYQSALGLTIPEVDQMAQTRGMLDEEYMKVVPNADRLIILDVHGKNTAQIERKIAELRPGVIVWDMLDKVKYVTEDAFRNTRTDEYLEGLYSWVRESGVIYDCVNVVSTQLSGDAENMQYPHLGMLKDSKTGKQGTADAILTFGSVDTYPRTRFLGLTKNKLSLGRVTSRLGEVVFDGGRGLITMPEEAK